MFSFHFSTSLEIPNDCRKNKGVPTFSFFIEFFRCRPIWNQIRITDVSFTNDIRPSLFDVHFPFRWNCLDIVSNKQWNKERSCFTLDWATFFSNNNVPFLGGREPDKKKKNEEEDDDVLCLLNFTSKQRDIFPFIDTTKIDTLHTTSTRMSCSLVWCD